MASAVARARSAESSLTGDPPRSAGWAAYFVSLFCQVRCGPASASGENRFAFFEECPLGFLGILALTEFNGHVLFRAIPVAQRQVFHGIERLLQHLDRQRALRRDFARDSRGGRE